LEHEASSQDQAVELDEVRRQLAALRSHLDGSAVTRLTDSLLDGFALFDPAAVVLDVNPALCEMTGFAEEELVGTAPPHPCWPPEDLPRFMRAMTQVIAGRARPVELQLLRKDGARLPVIVTPSVLRADDGEIVSVTLLLKDLSERRRFEAALAENEQLFRLTFDQAPIGAALFGGEHFQRVNDAMCAMLGYSRVELLGLGFLDVTHPDDREVSAATERLLAAGETSAVTLEKRYLRKDGGTVWARTVVRDVRDGAGRVIAQLAMIDDITERRHAVEDLRESESRLHTVLDAAHEGIILQAHDGTVLTFNKAAEAVFGVAESEVVGRSALGRDWQTIHEDGSPWPPAEHPTMIAMSSGKPALGIVLGVVRDGATRWLRVNAYPIVPEGETEPVAAVVSFSDQTERLQAEQALREGEERYRHLLQNANDAVIVHRHSGDPGDGLLEVNDRACELLGYSRDELLTMTIGDLVPPADVSGVPGIAAALDRGSHSVYDARLMHRDGRLIPVEVSTRAFEMRGEPLVLSTIRDISERLTAEAERQRDEAEIKRLNEELQRRIVSRTEQLDAVSHELEALAYSIAHDVRAPLRTIDGFSAAVLEDEGEALSQDAVVSLQRVRAAAQTLARLLDDLTGLSRVSRRELVRQTVDLTGVADEVALEIAREYGARSVELAVAPGLSAEVDPMLARIVLRELLTNAWKFTAVREVAHVEVGARDEHGERVFFVRDDGAGFDMRYAEHLFGVFQRMHPPGEFAGDGVGLAMVQRLVRRHGGRCWAEAEPDAGATFYFTLPGGTTDEQAAGPES
jgi:PAS domain S-box-containing protein